MAIRLRFSLAQRALQMIGEVADIPRIAAGGVSSLSSCPVFVAHHLSASGSLTWLVRKRGTTRLGMAHAGVGAMLSAFLDVQFHETGSRGTGDLFVNSSFCV